MFPSKIQPHLSLGMQKAISRPIDAHLEVWYKMPIKKITGNKKRERRGARVVVSSHNPSSQEAEAEPLLSEQERGKEVMREEGKKKVEEKEGKEGTCGPGPLTGHTLGRKAEVKKHGGSGSFKVML